jgi:hypothetical protein
VDVSLFEIIQLLYCLIQVIYLRFNVFMAWLWRMASSGMWHHVALARTDVSAERIAPIIRIKRIGELGTTLAVTRNWYTLCQLQVTANVVPNSPILVTLMKEALRSSETSVLTRATWHNIPEDTILHSHRRENLKSYSQYMCAMGLLRERFSAWYT